MGKLWDNYLFIFHRLSKQKVIRCCSCLKTNFATSTKPSNIIKQNVTVCYCLLTSCENNFLVKLITAIIKRYDLTLNPLFNHLSEKGVLINPIGKNCSEVIFGSETRDQRSLFLYPQFILFFVLFMQGNRFFTLTRTTKRLRASIPV